MKATGVVRRIDDLGRIVIPKEIRRNLKMNDGDNLEFFVNSNEIVLKKYSIIDNLTDLASKLVESFNKIYDKNILITDKDKIIAASKVLKEKYINSNLTSNIKDEIKSREEHLINKNLIILNGNIESYFLVPMIVNSDVVGSVILISDDINKNDKDVIRLINTILIKNIEE